MLRTTPRAAPHVGLAIAIAMTLAVAAGFSAPAHADETVHIASLEELAHYAGRSGNHVRMAPGEYHMTDFISIDNIPHRRENEDWYYLHFTGDENTFDLTGVTIVFDTELRQRLNPPIHSPEFALDGDRNTLLGLTIRNVGDGTSNGGQVLSVRGNRNTLRDVTLHVRGSSPYGYGDLFGKGGSPVIGHRKHSGLQIAGDHNRFIGCEIYMRSFGHAFFMQGAIDTYFEGCYVEGERRATDDMLAETEGPAYEADFRSVYRNRDGEHRVTPGYMKSLAEDAFRTYGDAQKVTFINCTAKHMRAAFELRTSGPIRIEGCTAIGNERGFWVGSDAVVKDSRGDAKYGPLLFLEGDDSRVELTVLPHESDATVHALASIHGSNHEVRLTPAPTDQRTQPLPIKLGYSQPGAGEAMSPYSERGAVNIQLHNHTQMPIRISDEATGHTIKTEGEIIQNSRR